MANQKILNKKKTAIVYDKWLQGLGGAEVVACTIARTLKDNGYEVLLITGKYITQKEIYKNLHIDITDIPIEVIWNDEIKLKVLTKKADLFVNVSFMDYSKGYAKKNIYYTHFPTVAYITTKGRIFNNVVLPFLGDIFKPYEFIRGENTVTINNVYGSYVEDHTTVAFYNIKPQKKYIIQFSLFCENFYSTFLKDISISVENAKILDKSIKTQHARNTISFKYEVLSESHTVNVHVKAPKNKKHYHIYPDDRLFFIVPRIYSSIKVFKVFNSLLERVLNRFRAGIFSNIRLRMKEYTVLCANSEFTRKWIHKYWKVDSIVLYPPVNLLFKEYTIPQKRRKTICSVGRFFTKGHGKRQEVLVEAFKKFYDLGFSDYELHLIGGLNKEKSSLVFADKLKASAEGYPIHFHFNAPRKKLIDILTHSQFFWMATGYEADENENPILFEHFGISAVEAMSAGCIPILYNGGGLKEIVTNMRNGKGALFNTVDELVDKTINCINEDTQVELKPLMKELDDKFSSEAFSKRIMSYVDK